MDGNPPNRCRRNGAMLGSFNLIDIGERAVGGTWQR